MSVFRLALGLLAICVFVSSSSSTPCTNGIPNFAAVDASKGIYRGGQPDAEGWQYLKSLGVTNVVKLNTENEGSDVMAEALGMKVWTFVITTTQQLLGGGVEEKIKAAASKITPNTYIHCKLGRNRTGTVIGYYRVSRCGWTKAQANKEMNQYGWGDSLPGLRRFWRTAAVENSH